MITPRFQVTQDSNTVSISIRAPYCSLRDLDVSVEDNAFIFVCKPYYLRLNLPGNIVENDYAKSKFNADTGEFTFTYEKETPDEQFKGLDFITTLLCPKVEAEDGGRKIEIITSENHDKEDPCPESAEQYGFAMRGGYNFNCISAEFGDVFKINPHEMNLSNRRIVRIKDENEKFDRDHYTADLIDNEEISEICSLQCAWKDVKQNEISFTAKELDFLKDLPNTRFQLSPTQVRYCHYSLVDILYAYCYDRRTTYFEGTCESGWTISTISASLCYFDGFTKSKDAVISAYRRSLIFPLYRSFSLCEKVFEDLKSLLSLGEKHIVKCLIELHDIFVSGDSGRFILNNLFVKDYIVFAMKWDQELWTTVVEETCNLEIRKTDLGLNLLDLEKGLSDCDLSEAMTSLKINKSDESVDSDDDSDSDCDSNSESDSNYESCSGVVDVL